MSPVKTPEVVHGTGPGGRLVAVDGRELPLRETSLTTRAGGGLARVDVRQIFVNPFAEPLRAHYALPLPVGGAVGGYTLTVGPRTIQGRIERRAEARRRFEEALIEGRVASILEQERTSLFTQEVGNVPPGAEVVVQVHVDQKLDWIPEGHWEWRFPTVVAPRYLGAPGRVPDADAITLDVAERPMGVRAVVDLTIEDVIAVKSTPSSPSHSIRWEAGKVLFAGEGLALDRDVVVRWPAATTEPGVALRVARPEGAHPRSDRAYGLLTIVPPASPRSTLSRDLILLLDTSGSMSGHPLEQARRIALDIVASLAETDTLEMIAFASTARRFRPKALPATEALRRDAAAWIESLTAKGGTEMASAMVAALAPVRRGPSRQVVVVTDGEVGFENEVCVAIRQRLPEGSRLHAVGIGSAVNRTLTRGIARAGRGTEILIGLDEDAATGAERLARALERPVLADLVVEGRAVLGCSPERLPDVTAGAPLLAFLAIEPRGGEIVIRGRSSDGAWENRLVAPAVEEGTGDPGILRHFAREMVEDLEASRWKPTGKGDSRILEEIEQVALVFGIASCRTSWVAVSEEPGVDPGSPTRVVRIPQEIPYGTSVEGMGLREALWPGFQRNVFHDETLSFEESAVSSLECISPSRLRVCQPGPLDFFQTPPPSGEPRTLSGHWIEALLPKLRVLEFTVTGAPLEWAPLPAARLQLDDGSWIEAAISFEGSTRPGTIGDGLVGRVVLLIAADVARRARLVEFECPAQQVQVRL